METLFIARVPAGATEAETRFFEVCNPVGSVVATFVSLEEAQSYVAYERFAALRGAKP